MWENYIFEINSSLLRFFRKESPELPTFTDIEELVALGKSGSESSLILSHLFFGLNDLKQNYEVYFDEDHWNENQDYDWFETGFLGHFDLFNNLDSLFKEVKKIGSRLTFEMYIDRYCVDYKENKNRNLEDSLPINENKFNTMALKDVRDFFKVLMTKKNPEGQFWMTESDLEIFIQISFSRRTDFKKPKINIGHGGKYAIVKLFWKYYDLCQKENIAPNRLRAPYFELLKNAFDTNIFDDLRIDNFKESRSDYNWD